MVTGIEQRRQARPEVVTANDRLKDSFNSLLSGCIAFAAAVHFVVLAFWPNIAVEDFRFSSQEIFALEIPPQLEIPPPPQAIPRPKVPVLSTRVEIDQEITIQEVTFASNPVESLPPPPTPAGIDLSEQPTFTPRTVEPRLDPDQRALLQRHLERNYPQTLLAAGIGARALVWVFINEEGVVRNTRIVDSSGYTDFDRVAQDAVRLVKFSPAWNRDVKVPVWIQLPITWQVG